MAPHPLQYCCLENSMDRRYWWAAVPEVAKSRTRLSIRTTAEQQQSKYWSSPHLGWFHFWKTFQDIFKGTTGFPSLAPSPPAARLLLESSLNFWLVKYPPLSSAWFPILNLLPRKETTFSINCRQELLTPSRWLCWALGLRLDSEGSQHYN